MDTISMKSCSRKEEYLSGWKRSGLCVKCSTTRLLPVPQRPQLNSILRFGLVAVMLVGGILVTAGSLSIPMFILFLLFFGRFTTLHQLLPC